MVEIRGPRPGDEPGAYDVCVRTAASGEDDSAKYRDPDLVGHVYVGPYLRLAPDFAFLVDDGRVSGYIVGAPDTTAFEDRLERDWWPALRARYPDPAGTPRESWTPDQHMIDKFYRTHRTAPEVAARYPAHLHINLLPHLRGTGTGGALMRRLLSALGRAGVAGVHLGVATGNVRARGFYKALGFTELAEGGGGVLMARPVDRPGAG